MVMPLERLPYRIPEGWGEGLPREVDFSAPCPASGRITRGLAWYISEAKTVYCCYPCWFARYTALEALFLPEGK